MQAAADLHLHTTASDGSCTPGELLQLLTQQGIHTFSVTDHDTIDGARTMLSLVPASMRYLPGVELTCRSAVGKYHILGYGMDLDDPFLQAALEEGNRLRRRKLEERIRYLEEAHGIRLTGDELAWLRSCQSPGKPHLGKLLLQRGLDTDGAGMQGVLRRYVNPFKGGNDRISAGEAISAIRHAGGVAVWAHPLGGEGKRHKTPEEFHRLLEDLLSLGIQGLECWYSRYTRQEVDFLTAQADAHGLLVSGGSDFHGTPKPGLLPGCLCAEGDAPGVEELGLIGFALFRL